MNDWIEDLNQKDLLALIPKEYRELAELDPDAAAKRVIVDYRADGLVTALKATNKASPKKTAPKKVKKAAKKTAAKQPSYSSLSQGIKAEFRLLVCTNSSKYTAVRNSINKHGSSITIMAVSTIAAAIATVLGITAGVVVPIVSILLLALTSIGINAWCGLAPAGGSQGNAGGGGQAKKSP